jgi:heme/copper-type cytochrome/quinol oxidase subunit 4
MFVETWMLLVIYAFAAVSLLIALWMFLTLEEMKSNGKKWVKLNQELLEKVEKLERSSGSSFFKK